MWQCLPGKTFGNPTSVSKFNFFQSSNAWEGPGPILWDYITFLNELNWNPKLFLNFYSNLPGSVLKVWYYYFRILTLLTPTGGGGKNWFDFSWVEICLYTEFQLTMMAVWGPKVCVVCGGGVKANVSVKLWPS